MITTQQSLARPRRIRAALIGLGLDCYDDHHRLTRSDQSLVFGGSAETHAQLQEIVLLMEMELDRQGQRLGDLNPPSWPNWPGGSTRLSCTRSPCGSKPASTSKGRVRGSFRGGTDCLDGTRTGRCGTVAGNTDRTNPGRHSPGRTPPALLPNTTIRGGQVSLIPDRRGWSSACAPLGAFRPDLPASGLRMPRLAVTFGFYTSCRTE